MKIYKNKRIINSLTYIILIILILSNITTITISNENKYDIYKTKSSIEENILYVGGKGENNYTSIQVAINDAKDGNTVYVYDESSPYNENLLIDKTINLIGENYNTTIIDGKNTGDVIYIINDNVNISGFTIKNSGNNWIDAGIKIESDNNNIKQNKIIDNKDGIYSYNLENTNISNNIISNNNYYGINIPFSTDNIIHKNTITDNKKYGIYLYDAFYIKIVYNTIQKNMVGIYLWHSFDIEINNNQIENNQYGIQYNHQSKRNKIDNNIININEFGIFFNTTSNNIINQNNIKNNIYGIYLKDTSISNITKNKIEYNENGIFLQYSPENIISENNFYKNKNAIKNNYSSKNNIYSNQFEKNIRYGISLQNSSNYNQISSNNFIDNNIHAYFKQSFSNKWEYNYWDDWIGIESKRIDGEIYILKNLIILNWYNIDKDSVENPLII